MVNPQLQADTRAGYETLRTRISQAFCFSPRRPVYDAFMHSKHAVDVQRDAFEIYWLDELLHGGLRLPARDQESARALTVLLTGPPGAGKTTLAMELCYRQSQPDRERVAGCDGLRSLYITSESNAQWMQQKARSYGWSAAGGVFVAGTTRVNTPQTPNVTVWETPDFGQFILRWDESLPFFYIIWEMARTSIPGLPSLRDTSAVLQKAKEVWDQSTLRTRIESLGPPDIVVVDSINTINPEERADVFSKFLHVALEGPRILILVLDANTEGTRTEFWSYVSDVVIRLDRRQIHDYLTRSIMIQKARYQSHVEGLHQLKIYGPTEIEGTILKDERAKARIRRAHPFRKEGGIFIYPSFHYHLSRYKRLHPIGNVDRISAPIKALNDMLLGGFPRGRCTALVGERGGHKSHLGYFALLHRVLNHDDEGALIISLRDDEEMARKTLCGIISDEFQDGFGQGRLKSLEEEGRLEILYYPPGFITPEEFFHRVYMSMCRFREEGRELTVLFNSVDQLAARFPLCASEINFIPGMIEAFTAEGATSFFIAVTEKGQPEEQYGLLAMADLLLSFEHDWFPRKGYVRHVQDSLCARAEEAHGIEPKWISEIGDPHLAIVVRVVRYAGGQAAGPKGILELVDHEDDPRWHLYGCRKGLNFTRIRELASERSLTVDAHAWGP